MIPFENLSNEAKIYIFPSSQKFHSEQLSSLTNNIDAFIQPWMKKHLITASYQLCYQRFVIFGIENDAIATTEVLDELVSFIFTLQETYNVILIDKLNVCFKQGEYVQYKEVKDFKKLIKSKSVTEETIVFNNLILTKEELENDWELPAKDTWYNRMF